MALFVVKRTTMKVKGVIFSASSPHLHHLNFKKKIIQIVVYTCKLNFTQSFFWKIIWRAFQDNQILAQISVLWILVLKIFWVWDAIVSPLLCRNGVKFSKMVKIILKICSIKKENTICWIQLNLELFLCIVSCCSSDINCKLSNNITLKQLNVIYYYSFSSKTSSPKKIPKLREVV